MDEVYTDGFGNYFDAYGRTLDINDLIARGIDVFGALVSRSPYYSPDDPRYPRNKPTWGPFCGPSGCSGSGQSQIPSNIPATVNSRGFQLEWWAAGLIGVVVGAFFLGKGKR